ncbi:hypothetical protein IT407_00555 [Candidatus Uhrbacteria bacterium]|nr:hypothetical protein [Candidatus Uhrbacteria bacterium]
MSTKRIERTVIEGGRYLFNKLDRYWSTRKERHSVRMMLHEAIVNDEILERRTLPKRRKVRKEFKDRLTPAFRWIAKHCRGMHPEQMKGFLRAHFDTRTIPGQHIVFDHLEPYHDSYDAMWRAPYSGIVSLTFHEKLGLITNRENAVALYEELGETGYLGWVYEGQPGDRVKRKKARIQMRQVEARKKRLEAEAIALMQRETAREKDEAQEAKNAAKQKLREEQWHAFVIATGAIRAGYYRWLIPTTDGYRPLTMHELVLVPHYER